uniref:Uncharacterized protein n=1 Tax=Thermofilum pendens TaxID=2269 RepID=A0A7C4BAU1_THEPE
MKWVHCEERALRKVRGATLAWYPYSCFALAGGSRVLLVDCAISSILGDAGIRVLLSRILPASLLREAEKPPVEARIIEPQACGAEVVEELRRLRAAEPRQTPSIFDTADYLAVRFLGVPSAMRKIEEAFKAHATKGLSPSILLEGLDLSELNYMGVVFQLLAIHSRKGRLYLLAGSNVSRLHLAEKLLREDRRVEHLLGSRG